MDRRFWVVDGRRAEFAAVFGVEGIWSRFLRQAPGYIATEVQCESVDDGRFRVKDFWTWHRAFEVFRERFSEAFTEFDRQIVDELVEKQEFVGAYYQAEADSGNA